MIIPPSNTQARYEEGEDAELMQSCVSERDSLNNSVLTLCIYKRYNKKRYGVSAIRLMSYTTIL